MALSWERGCGWTSSARHLSHRSECSKLGIKRYEGGETVWTAAGVGLSNVEVGASVMWWNPVDLRCSRRAASVGLVNGSSSYVAGGPADHHADPTRGRHAEHGHPIGHSGSGGAIPEDQTVSPTSLIPPPWPRRDPERRPSREPIRPGLPPDLGF